MEFPPPIRRPSLPLTTPHRRPNEVMAAASADQTMSAGTGTGWLQTLMGRSPGGTKPAKSQRVSDKDIEAAFTQFS